MPILVDPLITTNEFVAFTRAFLQLTQDTLIATMTDDDHNVLLKNIRYQHFYVRFRKTQQTIIRNLYCPAFPQLSHRLHPYNHAYWFLTDQFGSFHLPVKKELEYTYEDVLQSLFPLDVISFDQVSTIVHHHDLKNLSDLVSLDTTEPIVYNLKPTHLNITIQELNLHLQLTLSPFTTVAQLRQILEIYTSISKHQLILPHSDTDFVTTLPTTIGFPLTDRSDTATQITHLTDLTNFSSQPPEQFSPSIIPLSIQDDPIQFGFIPRLYWFTDIDINHLFMQVCQSDLRWLSPVAFLESNTPPDPTQPFLTAFTFEDHWFAIHYAPSITTTTITLQATIFLPHNYTPAQLSTLLHFISPLLPLCIFHYEYVPLVATGLCGPALFQAVTNWICAVFPSGLSITARSLQYRSYDYTENTLFCQAFDVRRGLPDSHLSCSYCGGMLPKESTPPQSTTHDTVDPTLPPPSTPTPTTYELAHSCADVENNHPLLSATTLQHFPTKMRSLPKRSLPPSIPLFTTLELLGNPLPPSPPTNHVHILFFAYDVVWRHYVILPQYLTHSQRIQVALPGMRQKLYDNVDFWHNETWQAINDYDESPQHDRTQYRFHFKKFLIPIYIQHSQHAFLLEVWPWFTIDNVIQVIQVLFHLPLDRVHSVDYQPTRPLTTIATRRLLVFSITQPTHTFTCLPQFTYPPDAFHTSLCWCQTVCQFKPYGKHTCRPNSAATLSQPHSSPFTYNPTMCFCYVMQQRYF